MSIARLWRDQGKRKEARELLHRALEAANRLAKNQIEAEVIDLRTLSPIDLDTVIESVESTGRLDEPLNSMRPYRRLRCQAARSMRESRQQ
jgi:hypothetical protein